MSVVVVVVVAPVIAIIVPVVLLICLASRLAPLPVLGPSFLGVWDPVVDLVVILAICELCDGAGAYVLLEVSQGKRAGRAEVVLRARGPWLRAWYGRGLQNGVAPGWRKLAVFRRREGKGQQAGVII